MSRSPSAARLRIDPPANRAASTSALRLGGFAGAASPVT